MTDTPDRPATPKEMTAEELAAKIVGRLGTLAGMAMKMDGAGAGIALSKQQEQIAKDIRAAVQAETERCARLATAVPGRCLRTAYEAWKQFVVGDACSVLMKRLCDQIAAEIREGEKF